MRLILKLKAIKEKEFTYNYNYQLSTELIKLLGFGKPEFSDYLVKKEIKLYGKQFNFFSFSLSFENVFRRGKKLFLRSNNATLTVSTPGILDEYLRDSVLNEIEGKHITALKNYPNAILNIKHVNVIETPEFNEEVKLRLLSPLVMSVRQLIGQKTVYTSLIYKDDINEINKHISENLAYKYKTLYNENIRPFKFQLEWDNEFITQNLNSGKKLTSKLSVEFGNKKNTVLGSSVPFTIKGNEKLIRVGYECGFGDMNSLGFGMVDIL